MHVRIDATALLVRSAGVKNYVYHWIKSLQQHLSDLRVTAFPALHDIGTLNHERSVMTSAETLSRLALIHFLNIRSNPTINVFTRGVDVFHASNLIRNIPRRPKLTATIYDLTVRLFPEFHTRGNVEADNRFQELVLRRADGMIAISQATKNDAVRHLGLDPDRIAVIYPGIDERFFGAVPQQASKPYVLFVGTIEPRKNIDTLLDAWAALPADIRDEYDLIIAGPIGWAAGSTVARLKSGIAGVRIPGYVPEADLPSLTAGASAFVYPSLYEGFGFPVAQAMAAGVPVISSNVSSMPEVVRDGGLLVDPRSPHELTGAMSKLLTSSGLRAELAARAKMSAQRFDWRTAGHQSLMFFQQLA
jgi:glycosyltransferase involved in cell wall biosynthesis